VVRGRTRRVKGGKKDGGSISRFPWYFFARPESKRPYVALAGRVQGGLFPEPTFTPPRKMGWNLRIVRFLVFGGMRDWMAYSTVTS
jgi:hypothetical protein